MKASITLFGIPIIGVATEGDVKVDAKASAKSLIEGIQKGINDAALKVAESTAPKTDAPVQEQASE